MELIGISVFVKVVQAGSFSAAAPALGMPISTVSAKVAFLEKRLGVTLLQRTTRKVQVTEAGAVYFQRCIRALEEIGAAESELTQTQKEPHGVLRVTAPVDVGHTLLPPLVKLYLKKYPQVQIELLITNRVVNLVAEGVDLALRAGSLEDSSLIAKKFLTGHLNLWASTAYLRKKGTPAHPKQLANHDWIRFAAFKQRPVELTDGKEKISIPTPGRITADDLETVKAFVLAGDGIALLPSYICEEESNNGKLSLLLPRWRWGSSAFSFVYPSQRFISPKVQAFIALAEDS